MIVDQYTNNVQTAIGDQQNEEDKIYIQLETMDQIINLLPKRIRKEPRQFQADKLALYNIAQQESMIDANLKNMKPFKMSDLIFPGEEKLVYETQPDRMLDKVILLPSGITKQNLIKMKFDVNIPQEIQKEYNINYRQDENYGQQDFNEEQKQLDYSQQHQLKIKPKQDSDYLYQLVSQERLRKFHVKSSNEYYLYTNIPPTQEDIEKRAQILAKLFCKYNLKEEQDKARKKEEERIRIKHHEQIQMQIVSKVIKNEIVTKEDLYSLIPYLYQKEKVNQKLYQSSQDVTQLIKDVKNQRKKQNQLPTAEELAIDEQEEAKEQSNNQDGLSKDRINQNNINFNTNNIGASSIPYNKEYEEQINYHIQKIDEYYQGKIIKYYQLGKKNLILQTKQEYEMRKKDFQSIHNPEVLLRHLLFIRQTKQIF